MRLLFESRRSAKVFCIVVWLCLLGFGYINWFRDDGGQRTHRSASIDCESGRSASSDIELNPNSSKRLMDHKLTVSTLGPGDGCYLKGQELRVWMVRRSVNGGRIFFRREMGRVKVQQIVRSTYARLGHGQRQFVERKFGQMARLQTYDLLTLRGIELRDASGKTGAVRDPHPYVEIEEVKSRSEIRQDLMVFDRDAAVVDLQSLHVLVDHDIITPEDLQKITSADRRSNIFLDPSDVLPVKPTRDRELPSRSSPSSSSAARLVIVSKSTEEIEAYNLISVLGEIRPELKIIWKREVAESGDPTKGGRHRLKLDVPSHFRVKQE